jgi:ribosomal protein L11 methyltransferase
MTALEECDLEARTVVDIGTGSGILAIAALRLGAFSAIGVDLDFDALATARQNFDLNGRAWTLVCGSADALGSACADVTVANISGTVLLSIFDDLLRITHRPGRLILTGFSKSESIGFKELLPNGEVREADGWSCLSVSLSA